VCRRTPGRRREQQQADGSAGELAAGVVRPTGLGFDDGVIMMSSWEKMVARSGAHKLEEDGEAQR
jgi:hypothetical protein